MKHKLILLSIMILSSLFSCSQKNKFEVINSKAKYYEFNTQRDKIYMLNHDKTLNIYDVNSKEITPIATDTKFDAYFDYGRNLRNPMFCANDILYIVCRDYIYKLEDDKITEKIPYMYKYAWGTHGTKATAERKKKEFNEKISSYDGESISILVHQLYILTYKDGISMAFYNNHLARVFTEENKKKIDEIKKENINWQKDTSYYRENLKNRRTVNYFENKGILINEKAYHCEIFRPIMSFGAPDCWYKINIVSSGIDIKFKDKYRRNRTAIGTPNWNCDLFESIPNSNYIKDKNGNVYLLFYFGEKQNLIRINKK